jgi:TolA-binding protein
LSQRFVKEFPNSTHLPYAQYSEAEAILTSQKADANELAAAKQTLEAVMKATPPDLPKDAFQGRAWVLSAEIAYREKKYDEIVRLAADLKKSQPKSVFGYQLEELVGRSHKQQADFPAARAAFNKVLADPQAFRTPTAAKSQFLIAETYFLEEKWEDAFLNYQKVYTSYDLPDWQAPALLQSGKCLEQLKEWKDAVKSYEQLIEEFPKSDQVNEARQRLDAAKKKAG